jgi:phenylalanyl-tRNA synthetase beta chain
LKVTFNWINEFLKGDKLDPKEAAEALTMSGTEVQKIEFIGERFRNIIVGMIKSFKPHQNAGRLSVCRVDSGDGELNIVCGAANFKQGDKVALAVEGAKIGDFTIERRKIRGEYSEGMMCSEAELGLSSASEGIMILDKNLPIGKDFAEAVGLDDVVYDLEITPNRPDCMSVIGIAREISAMTENTLFIPELKLGKNIVAGRDLDIRIEDYKLCPRYSAMTFENIEILDSPQWLKNRLILCGIRPRNIIVDLTNYVMVETGQPLHAFDRDLLPTGRIIVRNALKDEKLRIIDDTLIELDEDSLVIADEKKAIALAGIMGGKDTEITSSTKNVLLESANFYGPSIMNTSKKVGLRSEASNRFEKKIDPEITVFAVKRFYNLLTQITGYSNNCAIYDNYQKKERTRKIILRPEKLKQVLGQSIGISKISKILDSIYIKNKIVDGLIDIIVPSFRFEDLEREVDIIEEVARIYGYNDIISRPSLISGKIGRYTRDQSNVRGIRRFLADIGLNEVINYSFIGINEFKLNMLDKEEEYNRYIEIINPINEDFRIMRTSLLPSMMANLKNNFNRNIGDIAIFEISKVFIDSGRQLPDEPEKLGILLSGRANQKKWMEDERYFDFFDIKGIIERIIQRFYVKPIIKFAKKEYSFFHPGFSGCVVINGVEIGKLGRVHPSIVEKMEIGQDAFYAEIDIDVFNENIKELKSYEKISPFPSIDIDIAVIVDEDVKNEDVINEIKRSGSKILRSVRLFDIYRGEQITGGRKSMAYSMSFREKDRTLEDREVQIIVNRIVENLEKKFNAELRS